MQYLLFGLSLGLSAGLSPGPLMTLVITTSLRDGFGHGLRVATAPLITDLPIILLVLLVLDRLPPWPLAAIGLIGAVYVVYLGWETIRSAQQVRLTATTNTSEPRGSQSLIRGAVVNALNPHPYLFWAAVGGPTLLTAFGQQPTHAVAFLAGFYTMLVGAKVALAALVHSQSHLLAGPWYRRVLTGLGALLMTFGIWLAWQVVSGVLV